MDLLKKFYNPHKKSIDEHEFINLIHHHLTNNTPSGIKIREKFALDLPTEPLFKNTKMAGGTRSTHYDLQLVIPTEKDTEIIKKCRIKI